jgi:hypothetical protein
VGGDPVSVSEVCERLGEIPQCVVLILDNYDVCVCPALPQNAHMILSGREAPLAA